MASLSCDSNGGKRIQFLDQTGKRRAIRLGDVPKRVAESVKLKVESLAAAKLGNVPPPDETIRWLASVDSKLRKKLEQVGLVEESKSRSLTLGQHLADFFHRRESSVKPRTLENWGAARRDLLEFFGSNRSLASITASHTKDFEQWLGTERGLGRNTIRKQVRISSRFLNDAVDRELISRNPFKGLKTTVVSDPTRVHFVDRETAERVIAACTNPDLRLAFVLARYAGLRHCSETLNLRWVDIDFQARKMRVRSPKTEHHEGKGERIIPLFPELVPFLKEAQLANPEAEFVITQRTVFADVLLTAIRRAGLQPWPRLWNSLRSSRGTELVNDHAPHVAAAWLGHSELVAKKHYWQVTDADFEKAQNAAQQPAATASEGGQEKEGASLKDPEFPESANVCNPSLNNLQVSTERKGAVATNAMTRDKYVNDG
jgi:integrase